MIRLKILRLLPFFLLCFSAQAAETQPKLVNFGYNKPKEEVSLPNEVVYRQQLEELVKVADEQDSFNYKFLYKVLKDAKLLSEKELETGRLSSLNQGQVGSCVGYGTTHALEITAAANVAHRQQLREIWLARANPDAIYGLGRYENRGNWDGSNGSWSVEALAKYGSLHRLQYGSHDLRSTVPTDGRRWAAQGLPKELLEAAGDHKALACVQIKSVEEAKAALQNAYGIIICGQGSFSSHRDELGFIKKNGNDWAHCMAISSYRGPKSGKEGYLLQNSWGDTWVNGPVYPPDMPHGSGWITAEDLNHYIRQGDTFAIAGYEGFKKRDIKWEEVFSIGEAATSE